MTIPPFDWSLAVKVIIITLALTVGIGIKYLKPSLPDDNPVEEVAEYVIEEETGLKVDLTPNSPEK